MRPSTTEEPGTPVETLTQSNARLERKVAQPSSAVEATLIVVVACSAGDFEAPSELVSALPAEFGAAFIVVVHLGPGREKLLAESLAKRTIRTVMLAHDGLAAEHGHIYVIPANATLTVTRGRIRVTPVAVNNPADTLFTSLAQERGADAIGVVLSGGGSDGALGIRAVKRGGGTTFAQYPGSARFPEMPISAIETGCVDFVLRPNEIARELIRVSQRAALPAGVARQMVSVDDNANSAEAMALVRRCLLS